MPIDFTGIDKDEFYKSLREAARQGYSFYKDGIRHTNLNRFKSGKPLKHILSFEEWCDRDNNDDSDGNE